MADIIDLNAHRPHCTGELICLDCRKRWVAVWPLETALKDLECPHCAKVGDVIGTGQPLED